MYHTYTFTNIYSYIHEHNHTHIHAQTHTRTHTLTISHPIPHISSSKATARCRWWSSWLLLLAYLPILLLYLVWLPLTCMGKIRVADRVDL
ncbi:hypothetical protein EON63_20725 [archaeon]|nr:MAG: hypothetical protein EON63_20725 [archaeon]